MSIVREFSENNKKITITIQGQFSELTYDEYTAIYRDLPVDDICYEINLSGVTYMDSTGLGMLLLLREHAGGADAKIQITNTPVNIKKQLEIVYFNQLFDIS